MNKLSRNMLGSLTRHENVQYPAAGVFDLPEKVLQFGTGVLLRGLPDYYIDKANKRGVFKGRVVVVKSTASSGADEFELQDGLYTHCISGIDSGEKVEETIINASISRVLSANSQWQEVLRCAENPALEIVISNTTEVGIALVADDRIDNEPPVSFPGKLLAFLYRRYKFFHGDLGKGMVIVPTELIVDNGKKLEAIVLELAALNGLEAGFIQWIKNSNYFCSSLVDRIVPGKLPAVEKTALENDLGYADELVIQSECYGLWAIEAGAGVVSEKLAFAGSDKGVVIAGNINKFRELKLRLLNGTHTFSCGLAFLSGFRLVRDAMSNEAMVGYLKKLMYEEMVPSVTSEEISTEEGISFSNMVLDRFANPSIEHKWLSITMQYSSKMKMRNIPVLLSYYERRQKVPELMAAGFAAYILFMKCEQREDGFYGNQNGETYKLQDDRAEWFCKTWKANKSVQVVHLVLKDLGFWGADLSTLPGFEQAVREKLQLIESRASLETLAETRS